MQNHDDKIPMYRFPRRNRRRTRTSARQLKLLTVTMQNHDADAPSTHSLAQLSCIVSALFVVVSANIKVAVVGRPKTSLFVFGGEIQQRGERAATAPYLQERTTTPTTTYSDVCEYNNRPATPPPYHLLYSTIHPPLPPYL